MFPTIPITSQFSIPTYYLIISLTASVGLLWLVRRSRQQGLGQKAVLDLSLIIMVSGFIGARLLHVFYEMPQYYQEDWIRVLHFWNGGFVFYGGAFLAGVSCLFYLRKKLWPQYDRYLDLFAPVLSFTYALGRTACFLAGCCYGRSCELPWAIAGRHPTQIYASLWEAGTLLILLGIEKIVVKDRVRWLQKNGSLFYLWMVLHGAGRLLMETFRNDFRGPSWGLSVSSWISLAIIAAGVLLLRRGPANR